MKGRGKQLKLCAVKEVGLENNIPVLQPLKLRDEEFKNKLSNDAVARGRGGGALERVLELTPEINVDAILEKMASRR